MKSKKSQHSSAVELPTIRDKKKQAIKPVFQVFVIRETNNSARVSLNEELFNDTIDGLTLDRYTLIKGKLVWDETQFDVAGETLRYTLTYLNH